MEKGTWTIAPCPPGELRRLEDELGITRDAGLGAGAARVCRSGLCAGVSRGRAAGARPVPARRHERGGRHDPGRRRRRESGSASTATTTPTASARPRSRCSCCASSAPIPSGTSRRASRRATASNAQTVAKLAADGVDLVLTVDCGITAVAEVEEAKRLGLEVVVTDHHRPGRRVPRLPGRRHAQGRLSLRRALRHGRRLEARRGAPRRRASLPRPAPRHRRARHRRRRRAARGREPRARSRRLRRLAQTQKPGLQMLMRVAGVDPAACDEGAIGFRLAPRINASGRLGRPEAALSLLLSEDPAEAKKLAEQLEDLNRERQAVEERILRAATAEIESWPEPRRRHRGYVVAGEDWHEGVIGIVASRLVERFGRPVVLIAGSASGGDWKGSGRAGGTFDLHGALTACSADLERFGGHRAAAGLAIRPDRVEAFAAAFGAHADAVLSDDDLRPRTPIDAIVRGNRLGLPLVHELARLAPFGLGNPGITLLVDDCELDRARHGRRGQASPVPRPPARPRRRLGDRVRLRRPARPLPADRALRHRVPARGEPLERHGLAAARRPPHLRHRRALRGASRLVRRGMEAGRAPRGHPRFERYSTSSGSPQAATLEACSSRRHSGGSSRRSHHSRRRPSSGSA